MNTFRILSCGAACVLLNCVPAADDTSAPADAGHDTLAVELSIGGLDDRAEYEFGRVYGLLQAPKGGLIVADHLNDILRVYGADGSHVFAIGRRGAGPGEFQGPCWLAFAPAG